MRPRVVLLGALAARAAIEADVVINIDSYTRLETTPKIIDASKVVREQEHDIRQNSVRIRHFHDDQNKIKKFKK